MLLLGIMVLVLVLPLASGVRAVGTEVRVRQEVRVNDGLGEQVRERVREEQQGLLEQYRERLQLLKDDRKKAMVDVLNNRMCTLNRTRMQTLNNHLDRMLKIVNRVTERVTSMNREGINLDTLNSTVETARTAINQAQTAVETQQMRECAVGITGQDASVGVEIKNSIAKLEREINAVQLKVRSARGAVAQTIKALANVLEQEVTVQLEEGE